jgi:hypothetical protein
MIDISQNAKEAGLKREWNFFVKNEVCTKL